MSFASLLVEDASLPATADVEATEYALVTLCLLTAGRALDLDDHDAPVHRTGSVSMNLPGRCNRFAGAGGEARYFSVELTGDWLQRYAIDARRLAHLQDVHDAPVAAAARGLLREWRQADAASRIAFEGALLVLLAALMRRAPAGDAAKPHWLRRLLERLREDPAGIDDLTTLAAEIGVHPAHLARSLRRHTGYSLGELLRRERIEAACRAIAAGEASLADIALQAGFHDQSHFSRVFKRVVGCTPATYRRERG